MSWDGYIVNLMADGQCDDSAIFGYEVNPGVGVWASHLGGNLTKTTKDEIALIVGDDREILLLNGINLGGWRFSILRDNICSEEGTMDIKSKSLNGEPTCNATIAKSNKALIIAVGKPGIHGSVPNKAASDMATYLIGCGY